MIKAILGATALSVAALSMPGVAEAKPFNLKIPGPKVYPHPKPLPHPKHKPGWGYGGAAAAGFIGGMALGAMAASAAPAPVIEDSCYRVRRKMWDDEIGAFVVRRVTVCE